LVAGRRDDGDGREVDLNAVRVEEEAVERDSIVRSTGADIVEGVVIHRPD